jgi:polyhydroxybutyrate depolymerase
MTRCAATFLVGMMLLVTVTLVSSVPATSASRRSTTTLRPHLHQLVPGTHALTLQVRGRSRSLIVFVPLTGAKKPRPLVLVFHGALDTANATIGETDFEKVARQSGFAVAFLQGYANSWNDGLADTPANQAGVNDVAFTWAAITKLEAVLSIDRSRVSAVGFSNGALMVQYLGCHLASMLKLIVPVEGEIALEDSKACQPIRQISVFEVHATADSAIPYNGGTFTTSFGGQASVLSAGATVAFWAGLDGCGSARVMTSPNSTTNITTYSACRKGVSVALDTIVGGSHQWPTNIGELVAKAMSH